MEIEIDDIFEQPKKKKSVNSSDKGKRFERALCKVLKERFNFEFTRTIGSGNRHGQTLFLPAHAAKTFTGDLVCPENFSFVIEAKAGYDDVDVFTLLSKGKQAKIDEWIEQSTEEADRSGRKPIVCWKKSRKEWVAFLRQKDAKKINAPVKLEYKTWVMMRLDYVLKMKDDFFFN